jgi:hypothetical protein
MGHYILQAMLFDESSDFCRGAQPHNALATHVLHVETQDVGCLLLGRLQLCRQLLHKPLQILVRLASTPSIVNMLPEDQETRLRLKPVYEHSFVEGTLNESNALHHIRRF